MDVLKAIDWLFDSGDSSRSCAANEWLLKFQSTPEAWAEAAKLVRHPSQTHQTVGVNIFYQKLLNEWPQIPQSNRIQLQSQLLLLLNECCHTLLKSSQLRLCAGIVLIAIRTQNGIHKLCTDCFTNIAASMKNAQLHVIRVSVLLLCALGEELERNEHHLQPQQRHQCCEQMLDFIQPLCDLSRAVLSTVSNQSSHPMVPLVLPVLECLAAWTGIDRLQLGVTQLSDVWLHLIAALNNEGLCQASAGRLSPFFLSLS